MSLRTAIPLAVGAAILSSCASTPLSVRDDPAARTAARDVVDATRAARRDSTTWDAGKRAPRERPWLSASREDRLRLDALREIAADPEAFAREAAPLLDSMLARGAAAHRDGLLGLPDAPDDAAALDALAAAERAHLASLGAERDRRRWVDELKDDLPSTEPVGGRTWRMIAGFPAVPFLYAWIANHAATEDKGPYPHEFAKGAVYEPSTNDDAQTAGHLETATDAELLAFYAPTIVQQTSEDAPYDPSFDKIGRPAVRRDSRGRIESYVDPAQPAIFTHVTRAMMAGEWHTQLNYQVWYPEHPPLGRFDPEAGHTEGVMVRLTLDLHNRPLLAETAFACGCFHRIFPVEALEKEATETHGRVVSGRSALATDRTLAIDPVVSQSMGVFDPANPHPRVYVYGGKHFACAVEFGGPMPSESRSEGIALADAAELERLPLGDGFASFFRADGLVRGAERPESTMMFPSGLYHAGTPRMRGTHLIHFDQYDYDDPQLLEKLLRLPPTPFLQDINLSPYATGTGAGGGIAPPPADAIERAKKKGVFCLC